MFKPQAHTLPYLDERHGDHVADENRSGQKELGVRGHTVCIMHGSLPPDPIQDHNGRGQAGRQQGDPPLLHHAVAFFGKNARGIALGRVRVAIVTDEGVHSVRVAFVRVRIHDKLQKIAPR